MTHPQREEAEDPPLIPQTHSGLEDQGSPIDPRQEEVVAEVVAEVMAEVEVVEEEDLQ